MAFDLRKLFGQKPNEVSAPKQELPLDAASERKYQIGESIAGEFDVLDIFAGGMGLVYLVRQKKEEIPFVLKTLQRPSIKIEYAQFLKEAEIWLGLGRHRNIVRARFVDTLDGQLFVAADYIPNSQYRGNTIEAYVGFPEIPDGLLLIWIAQFCYGMAHAQAHGLLAHRDIKPANLMLTPDNELCITDFGLGRSHTLPSGIIEGFAERRSISGTLPYMAPEQFVAPETIDHRVDIYAIGIILYELICGSRPFTESNQQVLIQQILKATPKTLQSPLWPICERCLRKNPLERYQGFDDLLSDAANIARGKRLHLPKRPQPGNDENELIYARSISYDALGRPDLAMEYAIKYSKTAPQDDRAWTELGKQFLKQNRLKESVEASLRSIELAPFKSTARNNLGVALNLLGQFEESINQLKIAASNDPLNTGALLNQASPLMTVRRPLEAIQVLQKASKIAPEKASIWVNLGSVQMQVGLDKDAEINFKKALQLHPGLNEAESNLRTLISNRKQESSTLDPGMLIAKGQFEEAEKLLLQRVAVDRSDIDAWHNLGIIATRQRREIQAIGRFENVVSLKPDEEFARKQLIRLRAGGGDFLGALRECDELAKIPNEKIHATLLRAQLLQARGEAPKAIAELKALVKLQPENHQFWFMLSEIHEREGQFKESLDCANRSLALIQKTGGHKENIDMLVDRIARLRSA